MNSIIKIPTLAIAFVTIAFAFGIFATTSNVLAWGGYSGGDVTSGGSEGGDCCGSLVEPEPSHTPPSYNPPSYNPPTPPSYPAARCDAFSASPTSLPYGGGNVTLSWNTTNASSVSINQGVGTVAKDGSKVVFVGTSKTFTLTAVGAGGNDTCQTSVTVEDEEEELSCDIFTVSKSRVEPGENFTLRWETTGATHVSINQGIGSVPVDGSRTESVDDDTTYTLTASNDNDTVTCQTSVRVEEDEEDDDLRCELDISDDEIERGDSVRLSWETEGGDEILLKDDRGNVLVDTDDGDDYDVDEDDIRVKPTRDTEYRLTVFGNGDKETCEVDVEVDDERDVSVKTVRDQQPIVVGIPLTHVPYTGFEAGPVLTALFYTLLALWGMAIAYILVVKKGNILGFSLAGGKHEEGVVASTMTAAAPLYTAVAPEVSQSEVNFEGEGDLDQLDTRAHEARVLLSTDARNYIMSKGGSLAEQLVILDGVIASAKAAYPTENGWVVLNKARIEQLLG